MRVREEKERERERERGWRVIGLPGWPLLSLRHVRRLPTNPVPALMRAPRNGERSLRR